MTTTIAKYNQQYLEFKIGMSQYKFVYSKVYSFIKNLCNTLQRIITCIFV